MSVNPRHYEVDTPCWIRVVVTEADAPEDAKPIHDEKGNHAAPYFRKWIADTTYWAVRNNKDVMIYPCEEP